MLLFQSFTPGLLYKKESFGPSPKQALALIKEMENKQSLLRFKSSYAGIPHVKYLPGTVADLKLISAAEKEVIDRVIDQYSGWPASRLNTHIKEDMPFKATKQGEPIDYELVFYRKPPYTVRIYRDSILTFLGVLILKSG